MNDNGETNSKGVKP